MIDKKNRLGYVIILWVSFLCTPFIFIIGLVLGVFIDSYFDISFQIKSSTITTIATVVLALLTAWYVRLTNKMLKETRASRGPTVYVDLELNSFEVKLIIGNSGLGPAHNLRFKVKETIPWVKDSFGKGINHLTPIKDGITYLAPGRVLKFTAGRVDWKETDEIDAIVKFDIDYDDHVEEHHKLQFVIDMGQYSGVSLESFGNPASEIADAIRSVQREISSDRMAENSMTNIFKKNCPYCHEKIYSSAKKCFHCHEFINEDDEKD